MSKHRLYDSIDFKLGKPMAVLFMAKKTLMSKEDGWWMDGFWLEVLTDSISVISGWLEGDNERQCATNQILT